VGFLRDCRALLDLTEPRFPLLEALRGTAAERAPVAAERRDARAALERLERDGLLA
jgi:hypothetical protein